MIVSIDRIRLAHLTDGNRFQMKRRAPEHQLRAFVTWDAKSNLAFGHERQPRCAKRVTTARTIESGP
jgi:hypothetical protein